MLAMVPFFSGCESKPQKQTLPDDADQLLDFPAFITPVEDYFKISIGKIPALDKESYQLQISGAVNKPAVYTLDDLRNLEMVEKTLTTECIENPANGKLLGNATWKGFRLYDLLLGLGINEGVSAVKYICADGYYTYNTLEELQHADILGALYMNDETLPAEYGFPLRIIFPGYYGVRHPGWIVEIELLESGVEDYWSTLGWKTDSPMDIDSKILFPPYNSKFTFGDSVRIGGSAYGSRRIAAVDITVDDGKSWIPATIKQDMEEDYAWIFWEVTFMPQSTGTLTINSRATALDGSVQPRLDPSLLDGRNSWPVLTISVEEGS